MEGRGTIWVVGIGPGDRRLLTEQARVALEQATVIVGYDGYIDAIQEWLLSKKLLRYSLGQEVERARVAVARASAGEAVCVISSGDAGIYGMASLVLETVAELDRDECPDVIVVPGISSVNASAALLGAPLGHDFAVVSLSDLLTPWEKIEQRLWAVAEADFVVAILNPSSRKRDWQFRRAHEILTSCRTLATPVGIVRNAYREGQAVTITDLDHLSDYAVDMFTTVVVGNSQSRRFGEGIITPRGYRKSSESAVR